MIRAVLFDMGGTLDADGVDWLSRFERLYAEVGLEVERRSLRGAFDHAERRAAADESMAGAGIGDMLARHIGWQFDHLGFDEATLRKRMATLFEAETRRTTAVNAGVLAELASRGLDLGVVSNGCGNVEMLCRDFGYRDWLSVIIDSRWAGVAKPDPAIYRLAAARLDLKGADILMVGDSLERDIAPARSVGMHTAWVRGAAASAPPNASTADIQLRSLRELPGALDAKTFSAA